MTRVGYYKVVSRKGTGFITMVLTMPAKGVAGQVNVGVSFCSPRDQFCRERGKRIAAGRLIATEDRLVPHTFALTSNGEALSTGKLCDQVLEMMRSGNRKLPKWCENATFTYGLRRR